MEAVIICEFVSFCTHGLMLIHTSPPAVSFPFQLFQVPHTVAFLPVNGFVRTELFPLASTCTRHVAYLPFAEN
jgi:hypothetical protein